MLPLHTQKSLDALTWNEIQKIHASLGLKATATTRSRRDYQKRIVAAMPQPVVEPEHTVTPLTCATCPFAILLDDNRYECGAKVTNSVTRGHWEAKTDCYDAVAKAQPETETIKPATEVEAPITQPKETPAPTFKEITVIQPELHQVKAPKTFNHPFRYRADIFNGQHSFSSATYGLCECDRCAPVAQPTITEPVTPGTVATTTDDAPPNRGDNGRGRGRVTALTALPEATIASIPHATKPKADDNFMTAFTRESEGDRKFNDIAYLPQLEMEAQLAIERTVIGSEEEAIAYAHLRQIEADIKYYGQPKPEPQPSPVIQQLETQMKELKTDVLSLFKITAFDPSILPTCDDEPEQPAKQSEPEPEGTIHWATPLLRGVIVGKKGATRQFYIRNDEIFIALSNEFTASETKHPNIRHRQVREAMNLGRTFNPLVFKLSTNFERDTEDYNGIGRIRQECDGRWWAWSSTGVTGHPFFSQELACKYLDRIAASKQTQKQTSCIK
ncbi:hypothetical protein [Microcoleus sp. Pol12B5]|uniref:hypothetical protein n=1 Tax=Microcoleus sp. Pol12B5 TaxID=3055396 RepID=UPI002FD0DAA8